MAKFVTGMFLVAAVLLTGAALLLIVTGIALAIIHEVTEFWRSL